MTDNQNSQLSVKLIRSTENIEQAQEKIYSFLLSVIKTWSPEAVLQEFNSLFIQHLGSISSDAVEGLYEQRFYNGGQRDLNSHDFYINGFSFSCSFRYCLKIL